MSGTLSTTEYLGSGAGNSAYESGTDIVAGGLQYLGYASGYGSATDDTISGGGIQRVGEGATGDVTSTTIENGGQQIVGIAGGSATATSTTIYSGGEQVVGYYGGGVGSASGTTISGGTQYVGSDYGQGSATATTIYGGGLQVVGFNEGTGADTGATILSGGEQDVGFVFGAGTATSATVQNGGVQEIGGWWGTGTATSTTVESGGSQYVGYSAGTGTAVSATILAGGVQIVGDGGSGLAISATLSGGEQIVNSGGAADDTLILGGGFEQVASGGSVDNVIIDGGTLQLEPGATVGVDGVSFQPDTVYGVLDLTGEGSGFTLSAPIVGFGGSGAPNSDVIDVAGTGNAGDQAVWTQIGATGTLQIEDASNNVLETLTLAGTYSQNQFALTQSGGVDQIATDAPPCYCRGTRITTGRGEVAVQDLRVGDLALTASGALRPIRWIGHRVIDVSKHPTPLAVRPVRIAADAFGDGLPLRDLFVSPGHNIACEGALTPARALLNGLSVARMAPDEVEYWHVELDEHDILLAEGLTAESYLDTGNRAASPMAAPSLKRIRTSSPNTGPRPASRWFPKDRWSSAFGRACWSGWRLEVLRPRATPIHISSPTANESRRRASARRG